MKRGFSRLPSALSPLCTAAFLFFVLTVGIYRSSHAAEFGQKLNNYSIGQGLDQTDQPATSSTDADFHFDQKEWNNMRRGLEEGKQPTGQYERSVSTVPAVSTMTAIPPKPPPGQIHVDLPYESSLSVTGRKVIKVELKNTHITKERADELGTKQDTQAFTMEQELQARIQGTVARKTTINVNFDDTKENVRDFSVVYQGDPGEVVQEAAFGDITLSLPSTEFVNYNKQLFGVRTALKYKKFGLMAIGSKTKGTTETKRFVGTTTRNQTFINDTSYIRKRFYDLTFATSAATMSPVLAGHPVLPISDATPEVVYVEDTTNKVPFPEAQDFLIATPTAPTSSPITIRMKRMNRGVDYTIDRIKGVISFTQARNDQERIAIDFTLSDGTRLSSLVAGGVAVLIKDAVPETPNVSQEIKRYYFADPGGRRKIVPDNGLGNFVFKVFDQNHQTEIGTTLSPIQRYPDNIEMDFQSGIFLLKNPLPFPDVYAPDVTPSSPLHAVFSVEFQSILRTFTLKPNIVLQSEVIKVDGRRVVRDVDYFIDYDIGIITFFNDDLIRESTIIEATYEFAPFGGQLGETLVGARGTYDILTNQRLGMMNMESWNAGSTVLYDFANRPTAPPDVRSTPNSLLVTEGDTSVKGLKIGKFPMKTNFGVETARSDENPNIYGKALVESFEGLKQEDSSSMLQDSWRIAANPQFGTFNEVSDFLGRDVPGSHIQWRDLDVQTSDPNDGSATQKALQVNYSLNETNTAVPEQSSIINVISLTGRDFSKKSTLEIEVEGAGPINGAGVDLIADYGTFNEDADGDGQLDTEDTIPFDGILNLGEDVGFEFDGPGPDLVKSTTGDNRTIRIGASNARLDTEDLNNDGVLNKTDLPASFKPFFVLSSTVTDSQGRATSDLSFTGRRLFQIPLNISTLSDEEKNRLTAVRQVRLTIRNHNTTPVPRNGSIILTRVSMVGISWQPPVITGSAISTMTVRAINNKDDPLYVSLVGQADYNDLYKDATPSSDAKEQALALDYDFQPGSTGTTQNVYGAARDLSRHNVLKFFLSRRDTCTTNDCGTFFLQAGSDVEFQQAAINVADIPLRPSWKVVTLRQVDTNHDGIPESWVSDDPKVRITTVGTPTLSQVSQLKAGISLSSAAPSSVTNEVWLNEIFVSDPHERVGGAKKYSMDSSLPRWMDFGGLYRAVDRNWETPTTAITNQDHREQSAYLNFNRFSVMPMTFKTSRDVTATPSAFQANNNALVSVLEEGRLERRSNAATANLLIPKLPVFNFAYNNDATKNNLTQRSEATDVWRLGASYSPTARLDLIPGPALTFRPIPTSITLGYSERTSRLSFPGVDELNRFGISTAPLSSTNLKQFSDESEVRMAFNPWGGFNFNPTYKLRVDTEERRFRQDELAALPSASAIDRQRTPRGMAENVTASGDLRLLKWLDPRFNYSFSGSETNGLPTITNTTNYLLKTISRTSEGEVSGAIQMSQVLAARAVQSMNVNSSYKVENGDTYADVPKDFGWKSNLWVGTPLNISSNTNSQARRTDATDRRTFRNNVSWLPFSGYTIGEKRWKPLNTLSLTSNYLISTEDSETTGTSKRVISRTFPDLIMTVNDIEDFFRITSVIDQSRFVFRTNTRKTETLSISRSKADVYGTEYQFKFRKRYDVSTTYSTTLQRDDDLVSNLLSQRSNTVSYSLQTRIPFGVWAYTPRYQHTQTDARDSVRITNDLRDDIFSLQIYGDINKPLGIRFGRHEIGVANRFILNSTLQWEKKRSSVNPSTNYLDIYSGTLSGDYTLSKNFRMAIGGNFSQEVHHADFKKLNQTIFGLNTVLTIQF